MAISQSIYPGQLDCSLPRSGPEYKNWFRLFVCVCSSVSALPADIMTSFESLGKNTDKEGSTWEGRQRSGVFIVNNLILAGGSYLWSSWVSSGTQMELVWNWDKTWMALEWNCDRT